MKTFIQFIYPIYTTYFKSYFLLAISFLFLGANDSCMPGSSQFRTNHQSNQYRTQQQAKKNAVYILHGLNDVYYNSELVELAHHIKSSIRNCTVKRVPMVSGSSIDDRRKSIRAFMRRIEREKNLDKIFFIGHSFGGLLGLDVGTKLKKQGRNVAGVVTINSPVGGINLKSNDWLSRYFVNGVVKDLAVDRKALRVNSTYLQGIRSAVESSDLPILSIGSRCKLNKKADNRLSWTPFLRNVRTNLINRDMVVELPSQLAVKKWGSNPKNIGVKQYEDRAHMYMEHVILPVYGQLTNAPSILADPDVHNTIKEFITDPIAAIEDCKQKEIERSNSEESAATA